MKVILTIYFFIIGLSALAMGAKPLSPGQPNKEINDIVETTSGISQFSQDRGHQDQQMMEEKEVKKQQSEKIKFKKAQDIPVEKMKIHHE